MRLAVVLNYFPGLSTTFVTDQIIGLLELGHDVEIFAHRPSNPAPVHPQIEQHRLMERTHHWFRGARTVLDTTLNTARLMQRAPARTLRTLARSLSPRYGLRSATGYLWALSSTVQLRNPFDTVLCHFGENGIKAQCLREIGSFRAPLATIFHGYDLSRFVRQRGSSAYASLFRSGELMLPVSDYWATKLVDLGCPKEKIQVQRMGVDCRRFEFQPRTLKEGETPRILSVCRLVEKKGIKYAIHALSRVAKLGKPFEYHVVGDGPQLEALRTLSRDLDLSEQIHFHGALNQDEVLNVQRMCHVFLQPSVTAQDGDQEGIPVSIMEAMASGMPVVSTRHSGIPELVEEGSTGYLASERDIDELARKLLDILSIPQHWEAFGRRARQVVLEKHDRETLNLQLSDRLEQLAKRKGKI